MSRVMAIHHLPDDAGVPAPQATLPSRLQTGERPALLALRELTVLRLHKRPALDRVTLDVARGEILGIAAIESQGAAELAGVLTGQRLPAHGALMLDGLPLTLGDIQAIRRQGLARIPSQPRDALQAVRSRADRGTIAANEEARASARPRRLSLVRNTNAPRCLVAEHPTRGIDVGTAQQLHRSLLALRAGGTALLLISADVDELLALSDRLAVLFEGRLVAHFAAQAVSARTLSLALIGALSRGPVPATLDAPFTPGLPPHRDPV